MNDGMNRQQRRKKEREHKKEGQAFKKIVTAGIRSGKMNAFQEKVIRGAFSDGQIYNNHEWAVRLERIAEVKGVGPKLLDKILSILEAPVTSDERSRARKSYESGVDRVDLKRNR